MFPACRSGTEDSITPWGSPMEASPPGFRKEAVWLEPGRSLTQVGHWYPGMGARSSARPSPPLGRRGVPKGWARSLAVQVTITYGEKDPTPGGQILFALKEAGPQWPHSGVTRPPGAQPGLTSRSSAHHRERPRSVRGRQPFRCAGTKTKDTTGSFLQISGLGQPRAASWKPRSCLSFFRRCGTPAC